MDKYTLNEEINEELILQNGFKKINNAYNKTYILYGDISLSIDITKEEDFYLMTQTIINELTNKQIDINFNSIEMKKAKENYLLIMNDLINGNILKLNKIYRGK